MASSEFFLPFKEEIAPILKSSKELKTENSLQFNINKLKPSTIF